MPPGQHTFKWIWEWYTIVIDTLFCVDLDGEVAFLSSIRMVRDARISVFTFQDRSWLFLLHSWRPILRGELKTNNFPWSLSGDWCKVLVVYLRCLVFPAQWYFIQPTLPHTSTWEHDSCLLISSVHCSALTLVLYYYILIQNHINTIRCHWFCHFLVGSPLC